MTKERYFNNIIKGLIIVVLFIVLLLTSLNSQAQTRTAGSERPRTENARTARTTSAPLANPEYQSIEHADSLRRATRLLYVGIEGNFGYTSHTLHSDIPQLNKLRVSYIGGTIGGVLASERGKLKANAGPYYSEGSVPYTFNLLVGNLSANLYLLRIGRIRYHTVEPYLIGEVSLQQIKFYGSYLNDGTHQNLSISEEEILGKTRTTQFSGGFGAEFQLESDYGDFIHLFAEVLYGVPAVDRSNRKVFNDTHMINPVTIRVGVSLGKIRYRK